MFISTGSRPAAAAAATWLSPRCSRIRPQAHHRQCTASRGRPSARRPLNSGRPMPSAAAAALASRLATSAGSSPARTSRKLATVASSRACASRSGGTAFRAASHRVATRPGSNQAKAAATTAPAGSPGRPVPDRVHGHRLAGVTQPARGTAPGDGHGQLGALLARHEEGSHRIGVVHDHAPGPWSGPAVPVTATGSEAGPRRRRSMATEPDRPPASRRNRRSCP